MITYNNKKFFIVPKHITKHDMEFEIYNHEGTYLGTNLTPIKLDENNQDFADFIEIESHKVEAKIKFQKEFNIPIEDIKSLDTDIDTIFSIMESEWNVPYEIMDEVLSLNI